MSYHYPLKIAGANKREVGTDFSLQLLLLIYPATLIEFSPTSVLRAYGRCLKVNAKNSGRPSGACVHLFYLHDSTEFSCATHLHEARSGVYIVAWRRATKKPDPLTVAWQETQQPDSRRREDTRLSIRLLLKKKGGPLGEAKIIQSFLNACCITLVCHGPHKTRQINPESRN